MTIAFDVDGTLTGFPEMFKELMVQIGPQEGGAYTGFTRIVLTGCLSSSPTSPAQRQEQLARLGIMKGEHYDELLVVQAPTTDGVAAGKGVVCRERNVALMFEDTKEWIPIIKTVSPGTCMALVH